MCSDPPRYQLLSEKCVSPMKLIYTVYSFLKIATSVVKATFPFFAIFKTDKIDVVRTSIIKSNKVTNVKLHCIKASFSPDVLFKSHKKSLDI